MKRKRKTKRRAAARPPMPERLDFIAAAHIAEAAEGDDERSATAEIDVYTGGPLNLAAFMYPVWIDLKGHRIRPRVPVNTDHDRAFGSVIGHADARKENGKIVASATLARSFPETQRALELQAIGGDLPVSIGAPIQRLEFVKAGSSASVNGQTARGPVYIARASELDHISFVSRGADARARARIAASDDGKGETMTFEQWAENNGFDIEAMQEERPESLEALRQMYAEAQGGGEGEGENGGEGGNAGGGNVAAADLSIEAQRALAVAETDRVSGINRLAQNRFPELTKRAIAAGWSVDRFELELRRQQHPTINANRGSGGRADADLGPRLECALLASNGWSGEQLEQAGYGEQTIDAAFAGDMRDTGLQTILFETINAADGYVRAGRVGDSTIRQALHADRQLIEASGGFSTISLSGILGNVANKTLLQAFQDISSIVDQIASSSDVQDFKQHTRFRMLGVGNFEKVGPGGELKHATLAEDTYAQQIDTYGRIISLTRQMMMNDDLGAFLAIPQAMGRMAALRREKEFYEVLLGSGNFFEAAKGNYIEGATTALSIDSLTEAEALMRQQKDSTEEFILIEPTYLLVPTALATPARNLMASDEIRENGATKAPTRNPHRGKFTDVSTPYIGAASPISGGSDVAWYLLGPARQGEAIIDIAYLRGRRQPTVESSEARFDVLGMEWRSFWDFGIALQEYRGGVKSKGEA